MHEHDFELMERREAGDGIVRLRVLIRAAGLERVYAHDPATDSIRLDDAPILVGGHDMTSIIGKRVREWLRSAVLDR